MRSQVECFAKAAQMVELAAKSLDGDSRMEYFSMAWSWRELATQAETQAHWARLGEPVFSDRA
jgi:hypothetical protein